MLIVLVDFSCKTWNDFSFYNRKNMKFNANNLGFGLIRTVFPRKRKKNKARMHSPRAYEMFLSVSFVQPNIRKNRKPFKIRRCACILSNTLFRMNAKWMKQKSRTQKMNTVNKQQIIKLQRNYKHSFQMLFYGFCSADPSEFIHCVVSRSAICLMFPLVFSL